MQKYSLAKVRLMGRQFMFKSLCVFLQNPRNVFIVGLLMACGATFMEVIRERASNFYVYADATCLFWEGVSPYTHKFVEEHARYFLYSPVFNFFFTPFALMPGWLGPFAWNIMNYTLMFFAIWTLPKPFKDYRLRIFVFLLSLIGQSVFCFQYNLVVCYIFLFSFTLLERGKYFLAILLIMFSATTKVYGVIELFLLLCYPKMLRKFGYAILCGAVLLLIPALNVRFDNVFVLYQDMINIIGEHNVDTDFAGILYAKGLKFLLLPYAKYVQIIVLVTLVICFCIRRSNRNDVRFRAQMLAIMMGYIVLFSDCPETHTYIISISGYLLAFWLQPDKSRIDWLIFYLLFVNYCILPTDVICPTKIFNFFHYGLWLDVYVFFVCWLRTIWWAMKPLNNEIRKI